MKATDILKRFEAFLNRYEFSQMKLENGTILEADEFAEDNAVFIVTDDERVPLPIGDYELENGSTLIVAEEGVIGSIGKVENAEKEIKEEMNENLEETKKEMGDEPKEETTMGYVSREELEDAKAELKEMIEEVKAKLEEAKEEVEAEETKDDEAEKEELKAELSKPATEPLKHNPEAQKTVSLKKIGKNRTQLSVMDRIMNRISNIEN